MKESLQSLNSHHAHSHTSHTSPISNRTIAGTGGLLDGGKGCKHTTSYFTNPNVRATMCVGMTDQDLKNGMSIINLINSRGYLPTCRVMQLMLWMASMVETTGNKKGLPRDTFVDIGANIGSCSVHMASLGFPVISVEPVQQHVDTIRGTIDINPSFHIELHHIGLSSVDRSIHATFGDDLLVSLCFKSSHQVTGRGTGEQVPSMRFLSRETNRSR